jgi:hypothetical protein
MVTEEAFICPWAVHYNEAGFNKQYFYWLLQLTSRQLTLKPIVIGWDSRKQWDLIFPFVTFMKCYHYVFSLTFEVWRHMKLSNTKVNAGDTKVNKRLFCSLNLAVANFPPLYLSFPLSPYPSPSQNWSYSKHFR